MGKHRYTSDPKHNRQAPDAFPCAPSDPYFVLPDAPPFEEPAPRPLRTTYVHERPRTPRMIACGGATDLAAPIARTFARDPTAYKVTYCVKCRMHQAVDQFDWLDHQQVGS